MRDHDDGLVGMPLQHQTHRVGGSQDQVL
jgi:hypothetical protein